jgi:hypothetical protein
VCQVLTRPCCRRAGGTPLLQRRSLTARAVSPSVNPRQRRGTSANADAPRTRRRWHTPALHLQRHHTLSLSAHRRLFGKRFANQKKVVTLSARNRFALHGVRLKGNAVRIGDSTRCCDSRRTWATISHCKPSERLREGSPTGRDKSEDLPVSEKLYIDAFGS